MGGYVLYTLIFPLSLSNKKNNLLDLSIIGYMAWKGERAFPLRGRIEGSVPLSDTSSRIGFLLQADQG